MFSANPTAGSGSRTPPIRHHAIPPWHTDHASLFRTRSDKLDHSLRRRPNGYRRQEAANPVRS
jgi:hypothetical protein